MHIPRQPQVVIIGAGFGGLWAARALREASVDVLVLDRNNYHTFLPLLYQVGAAELEPEHIVYPVRSILRRQKNVRFLMEEVTAIDMDRRRVYTTQHNFRYDYLILALGSRSHFYDVSGAKEHAFELKTLDQAIGLRNHILMCFEQALCESDPEKRSGLLTFTIVGGGPTGIEFTGALAELVRHPIQRDYPMLNQSQIRVILLEATDSLLPGWKEELRQYTLNRIGKMSVEVRLEAVVERITPDKIYLSDGEQIRCETTIWTAGVRGETVTGNEGLPVARQGRIAVLPSLQVSAVHPEVYVIGDMAYQEDGGNPLPMIAPVAIQQGEHAAANILRQINGKATQDFSYDDPGSMVTIGRNAAVVRLGKRTFTGFPAWVVWLAVHLFKLIGFRNRLLVIINWAWDYIFYERAVRLIFPAALAGKPPRK